MSVGEKEAGGGHAGSAAPGQDSLDHYRARFTRTLDQLNAGDLDEMVTRYAPDVTIVIPHLRPGDVVLEQMYHGRAGLRGFLLRIAAAAAPFRLLDVSVGLPGEIIATIEGRAGRRFIWRIEMNSEGLGKRVVLSMD